MWRMYAKNRDLNKEISLLRTENGNLQQKIANLNEHNWELQKLIETMSEQPRMPPGPSGIVLSNPPISDHDAAVPLVITHNRYAPLASPDVSAPPSETLTSHAPPRAHHGNHGTARPQWRRTDEPARKYVPVTIVGSSIVRRVAPLVYGQDIDASGYVFPGRTARQINAELRNIPTSDITVLAAGTNNLETQTLEM